jgi:exonuclease VII small subunit
MPTFQRDVPPSIAPVEKTYEWSLARIEQLQSELEQRDKALDKNLSEQMRLRESLKACIQTIQKTQRKLSHINIYLHQEYRQIHEHIEALEQEIRALESSNAAWSNRSITLQIDVLSAQNEMKASKAEHDLAANIITLQEMELNALKMEKQSKEIPDPESPQPEE